MTDPVVPPVPAAVAPIAVPVTQKRRNPVGIAAFVVGLIAFLSPAIAVVGGFALIGRPPSVEGLDFFTVVIYGAVGAGVGCVISLVAGILAIISFVMRDAKRMWGVIGLVLAVIAAATGWIPLVAYVTTLVNPVEPGVPLNG